MPTATRVFNFSAGPAVLPLPVLEEAQRDLIALAGVPANYKILMLQGGATLQFSMVPMNLLGAGQTADYVDSGSWADKAAKEAKKVGKVNIAATTKGDNYSRLPEQSEITLTPGAAYVHMTSNNTIEGTEWKSLPGFGYWPLVSDTSSNMFSGPIDVARHAIIYAGSQKNLGPSGVTLVIIREDLLARSTDALPIMLNYKVQAENDSLYNTPNTFGIYILGLTMKWLRSLGGLDAIAKINQRKAGKLYAEIDRTGFFRGTARKQDRSLMNVTFRLATEELEKAFVKESTAAGFDGLKGHRSVGGMRASIYNAFPEEGVDALVSFMRDFERAHG